MQQSPPNVVVLAGPNGAGKSTSAPFFLQGAFIVAEFVNADTIAKGLSRLIDGGYCFHLVFLWLPDADLAVARVQERVRLGGHDVPEITIRRRYAAGLRNFVNLYQPLSANWAFFDNSGKNRPRDIASGCGRMETTVQDVDLWNTIRDAWTR